MVKTIPAGAFKNTCLALLDEVATSGVEYVVTKRGKAVARISPLRDAGEREAETLARLRARTRVTCDEHTLLAPTTELAGWRSRG